MSSNTSAIPAAVTSTEALGLLNGCVKWRGISSSLMTSLWSLARISSPNRSQPTDRSQMPTCWRSLVAIGHGLPPSIGVLRRWLVEDAFTPWHGVL